MAGCTDYYGMQPLVLMRQLPRVRDGVRVRIRDGVRVRVRVRFRVQVQS